MRRISLIVALLLLSGCQYLSGSSNSASPSNPDDGAKTDTAEDTVKSFYRLVEAGKPNDAYKLLSRRMQEKFGPPAQLTGSMMKTCKGIRELEVTRQQTRQNNDKSVFLTLTITYNGCSIISKENWHIVKIDGEWRLYEQALSGDI